MRAVGAATVALVVATAAACVPSGSEVCDALRATPEGLEEISTQGGTADERAAWFTVLTTGVLAADPGSREQMAAAVAADAAGFERILAASDELEAQLRLLRDLAADPARGTAMSSAPDTVEAARDVSAFVGEECGD